MDPAEMAKNLLLDKSSFKVHHGACSTIIYLRFSKDNEKKCEKFIKQISDFAISDNNMKAKYSKMENPYGDSILVSEIHVEHQFQQTSIKERLDELKIFMDGVNK